MIREGIDLLVGGGDSALDGGFFMREIGGGLHRVSVIQVRCIAQASGTISALQPDPGIEQSLSHPHRTALPQHGIPVDLACRVGSFATMLSDG